MILAVKPRTYLPFFLAAHGKVPCVALIHDLYTRRFVGWAGWALQTFTLRLRYDHILTVSDSVKQRLSKHFPSERVSVVYNGINLDDVDSVTAEPKKASQVVFVGNLQPHKNIMDAIRAIEVAHEQIKGIELDHRQYRRS